MQGCNYCSAIPHVHYFVIHAVLDDKPSIFLLHAVFFHQYGWIYSREEGYGHCPCTGVELMELNKHRQLRYVVCVYVAYGVRGVAELAHPGPEFISNLFMVV